MALSGELCGILAVGAEKERKARDLYAEAAEKTYHPLGKKMFARLAQEETNHEQLLASWAAEGACPVQVNFPPVDKEFLARELAKAKAAGKPNSSDLEAIELGQQMERKSIEFYKNCAARTPDQASKDLFLRLRGEEDKHLAILSDLYEYMANPNVWETRQGRAHFDA
jgi:rubrerythrin